MPQKHSDGIGTEAVICAALKNVRNHKITRDPRYLDDEKLPERERVAVLRDIFHRNTRTRQIKRLANALSSVLQNTTPPNLLVYGPSGAGKSVTCLHFLSALAAMADKQNVAFHYFYLDLTTPRTCFGALNELAIALDGSVRRYQKGIPLEQMQEAVVHSLRRLQGFVCILVDEADNITRDADLFLTFLAKTLPKRINSRVSYVFLTNRLDWEKALDPRILAALKKQDAIFEPYDADDLLKILKLRVEKALDATRVDEAALRKIAALASRETGDARKAVEILAKSVKVAEDTTGRLTIAEVNTAQATLEVDKTEKLIQSLALQQRLALCGCYLGLQRQRGRLSTGMAHEAYSKVCREAGVYALSQRRFSDMVSFLDLYGLVSARVICRGRWGKTRELTASLPSEVVKRLLQRDAYA
jgi:archaeal cell division control protein 6